MGGKDGGRKREREGRREGRKERGREREREMEGRREGGKEREMEGRREGGRKRERRKGELLLTSLPSHSLSNLFAFFTEIFVSLSLLHSLTLTSRVHRLLWVALVLPR